MNSSMQKKTDPVDIHSCLLNVYGDPAEDVSAVRGGGCVSAQQQWVTSAGAGFHVHGMQALAHHR